MVPHTVHTWSPIFFSTALQGRNNDALFRDGNLAQRGYDTSSRYTAGKQQASTEQSNLFTLQVTKLKLREWRDLVPKVTHNPANRARLFRDIVTMFKHTYDLLLWRKGEGCWSFTKQLLKSGGKDACDLRSKIWSQSAWVPILALSLTSWMLAFLDPRVLHCKIRLSWLVRLWGVMGHGDRLWINLAICAAPGAAGCGLLYPLIWTQLLTPRCPWRILTSRWLEPYVACGTWIHLFAHSFSECFLNIALLLFSRSVLTLCLPMDCKGLPVHHRLLELAQTHVHWVEPSHPLLSPSPPAFNLSQHQGLSQWVRSLHQVAKGLEFQHQSFQWIFRTDLL